MKHRPRRYYFIPLIGSFVFFTLVIGFLPRYMSCENASIVSDLLYRHHDHCLGSLNPFWLELDQSHVQFPIFGTPESLILPLPRPYPRIANRHSPPGSPSTSSRNCFLYRDSLAYAPTHTSVERSFASLTFSPSQSRQ